MRKAWIKDDKIQLKFGGDTFHSDLALVKSISGRRFDPGTKYWTIPDTHENRETLYLAQFDLSADIAVDFVDSVDEEWKGEKLPYPPLVEPYSLYPFQEEALKYIQYHGTRSVLGMPMGSGKTLVSLSQIEMMEDSLPALIICPAPVKVNFQKDYAKFFGKDNIEILEGDDSITKYKKNKIYVVNYELLSRAVEKHEIEFKGRNGKMQKRTRQVPSKRLARFAAMNFKVVIADEVHRLKNEDSNAFFAFKEIIEGVPTVLGMSGTPILSRPSEIWSYWNTIKPGVFKKKQLFLNRYCNPRQIHVGGGRRVTLYDGATNMKELNIKLRNNGLLVMKKEEIMKDLPPQPVRTVIPLHMDNRGEYEAAKDAILDEIYENPSLILTKFEKLKQLAVRYKTDYMFQYIDNILDIEDKVVVFAEHQKVVEQLHKRYKNSAIFNGTLSPKQKEQNKEKFINDPDCHVIIGNTQSMGTGVDGLQKSGASNIVFVELPWNPSDLDQAEARLWRDGFTGGQGINVHYLVAEGTIEEEIIGKLDAKKTVTEAVIKGIDVEERSLLTVLKDRYLEEARKKHER